ncbi:MFS transporter [Streptomyces sp. NPDC056549]|uniref:MFS transporter n=1 Tax=Streptomyces sp. NPDC056549 TaxID=3345864 RepID=UPI003680C44D
MCDVAAHTRRGALQPRRLTPPRSTAWSGLSLALVSQLVGWAIDRCCLRTPLVGGLLLYGVAGGAGLVTESYAALIISRFVYGIGATAVFIGTLVALLALYQGEQRDRVAGWRSTALSLGVAAGGGTPPPAAQCPSPGPSSSSIPYGLGRW